MTLLCCSRISLAIHFKEALVQALRASRESNETPSTSSSTPLTILKSAISLRYRTLRAPCDMGLFGCGGRLIGCCSPILPYAANVRGNNCSRRAVLSAKNGHPLKSPLGQQTLQRRAGSAYLTGKHRLLAAANF